MQLKDWLEILAIALSPLIAVQVTEWLRKRSDAVERKRDLFRTLMATRRVTLNWDRVQALNLIDVEFYKSKPVRSAWNALVTHLTVPNVAETDAVHWQRAQVLTTDLLHSMAKDLGYELDRTDIERQAYYPQGSLEIEGEWNKLRKILIELLEKFAATQPWAQSAKQLLSEAGDKKDLLPPS